MHLANIKGKIPDICTEEIQQKVRSISENITEMVIKHKDIELGMKIGRLYSSLYDFRCSTPKRLRIVREFKK